MRGWTGRGAECCGPPHVDLWRRRPLIETTSASLSVIDSVPVSGGGVRLGATAAEMRVAAGCAGGAGGLGFVTGGSQHGGRGVGALSGALTVEEIEADARRDMAWSRARLSPV